MTFAKKKKNTQDNTADLVTIDALTFTINRNQNSLSNV